MCISNINIATVDSGAVVCGIALSQNDFGSSPGVKNQYFLLYKKNQYSRRYIGTGVLSLLETQTITSLLLRLPGEGKSTALLGWLILLKVLSLGVQSNSSAFLRDWLVLSFEFEYS